MTTPAFSIATLLARTAALKIKPAVSVTESFQSIQRKDTQRNNRVTMQSIIEESNIDSHELDACENNQFFESFE